ncbi:MAG TPA: heavy metal-binding domain-containing protein [Gaiellaceae bacterium]|nr:heavy metal-binding domain-containing protein [Gaiellaceae bacterium]
MPFLRRRDDGSREGREAAAAEQAASIEALERGGLPLRAQQRLAEFSADSLFTSDLSVNEFALTHALGLRPLAQVMGSSIYHVGWQQSPGTWGSWQLGGVSQELTTLSEAWNTARRRAFGRLEQEARLLGAHAVVGVQLKTGRHDWAAGAIEYIAMGTAVRVEGAEPAEQPVLTDLSAQDYWQLSQAGYRPLGIVGASAVYYIVSGWQQRRAQQGLYSSWANQELGDFTQGVYDVREAVIGRVSSDARNQGASGMVGVSLAHTIEAREVDAGGSRRTDLVVTMHVLGTSIAERHDATRELSPAVRLDLSADPHPEHLLGGAS